MQRMNTQFEEREIKKAKQKKWCGRVSECQMTWRFVQLGAFGSDKIDWRIFSEFMDVPVGWQRLRGVDFWHVATGGHMATTPARQFKFELSFMVGAIYSVTHSFDANYAVWQLLDLGILQSICYAHSEMEKKNEFAHWRLIVFLLVASSFFNTCGSIGATLPTFQFNFFAFRLID